MATWLAVFHTAHVHFGLHTVGWRSLTACTVWYVWACATVDTLNWQTHITSVRIDGTGSMYKLNWNTPSHLKLGSSPRSVLLLKYPFLKQHWNCLSFNRTHWATSEENQRTQHAVQNNQHFKTMEASPYMNREREWVCAWHSHRRGQKKHSSLPSSTYCSYFHYLGRRESLITGGDISGFLL